MKFAFLFRDYAYSGVFIMRGTTVSLKLLQPYLTNLGAENMLAEVVKR
jgi:hypothetical protein